LSANGGYSILLVQYPRKGTRSQNPKTHLREVCLPPRILSARRLTPVPLTERDIEVQAAGATRPARPAIQLDPADRPRIDAISLSFVRNDDLPGWQEQACG
jgi:hypothetical protein